MKVFCLFLFMALLGTPAYAQIKTPAQLLQEEQSCAQQGLAAPCKNAGVDMQHIVNTFAARTRVSVSEYGAVGDAVNGVGTDNQPLIQAAINAVAAAGGGMVDICPTTPNAGNYGIASPITLKLGVFLVGCVTPGYFDGYDAYLAQVLPGSNDRISALNSYTDPGFLGMLSLDTSADRNHGYGIANLVIDGRNVAPLIIGYEIQSFLERKFFGFNFAVLRSTGDCIGVDQGGTWVLDHFNIYACGRYGFNSTNGGFADSVFSNGWVHSNTTAGYAFADGDTHIQIHGGKIEENATGLLVESANNSAQILLFGVDFQHNSVTAIESLSNNGTANAWPIVKVVGGNFDSNGYAQSGTNSAQIISAGGRVVVDDAAFSDPQSVNYHFRAQASAGAAGKIWYRNITIISAAAIATTSVDGTGVITADGGSFTMN